MILKTENCQSYIFYSLKIILRTISQDEKKNFVYNLELIYVFEKIKIQFTRNVKNSPKDPLGIFPHTYL